MSILEEEITIILTSTLVKHFEELNYNLPKRRDKWGTLTVPKGSQIAVKVDDLPKGSHIKLTKVCDNNKCDIYGGRHVPNQQYRSIILSRDENDGIDLCKKCSYKKRGILRKNNVSYENSLEYFTKENNMDYILEEFSSNNIKTPKEISKSTHDKYLWNCFECGEKDYKMSVANRTGLNQNCPKCAGNIKKTTDQYKKEVFNLVGIEYSILAEYSNTRTVIKTIHNKCDFVYYVTPNNFLRGRRCPLCTQSKGENAIVDWLRKNNCDFEPQKEFEGLLGFKGGNLSYDFYIPNKNILIEYQGQFHDGSNGDYTCINLESQIEHDKRKREFAQSNNIELLEIWYWDFNNIEEILENKIFEIGEFNVQ